MFTHFYYTSGDDLSPVISGAHFTLSFQIFFIPPYPQLTQQTPKHAVELMLLGWVRTTRPTKELWW